ncbi:MAG TPA: MarR family winged helix-turn-helix transcriptional regulator [Burkholderiaceae bacterium]|nr:MarR family winged helix-turn-helix transcriptional regulator [Burkholderiaceae bacterium]
MSARTIARVPARGAGTASPKGCTSLKLRQLSRRVSQHFDHIVGAAGLKTTQYSLLSHIVTLGPVRPGELADAMEMDASTLTRNLQPLIAQGWVTVGAGADGRTRSVEITEAGRAKRGEAQRDWKRAQLELNERLAPERVARLHSLIDECLVLMNESAGGDDE